MVEKGAKIKMKEQNTGILDSQKIFLEIKLLEISKKYQVGVINMAGYILKCAVFV